MDKQWFKSRLKSLGKTQNELAAAMEITAPRVSEIIREQRSLSIKEAFSMAAFLEVSIEELYERLKIQESAA